MQVITMSLSPIKHLRIYKIIIFVKKWGKISINIISLLNNIQKITIFVTQQKQKRNKMK